MRLFVSMAGNGTHTQRPVRRATIEAVIEVRRSATPTRDSSLLATKVGFAPSAWNGTHTQPPVRRATIEAVIEVRLVRDANA